MKKIGMLISGMSVLLLLVGNATAVTMLDYQGGASGVNFDATWDVFAFGGYLQPPSVGVTPGPSLTVTGNTVGQPISTVYASLFTTEAFAGNMTAYTSDVITTPTDVAGMGMSFSGGAPSGLGFYFASENDGVWFYDILPSPVSAGTYGVSFDSGGWYGFGANDWSGSAGDFNTALTEVTQVGFFVYFNSNADQTYTFSEFGLTVPEPETYMALGMALLGMAFVFRKRITESLAEARTMMQV